MQIGDGVKIKECHKIPELVGREAKIVAEVASDISKYPFRLVLTGEPITVETPLGTGETKGPFGFREDELELKQDTPLPDFLKDFDKAG